MSKLANGSERSRKRRKLSPASELEKTTATEEVRNTDVKNEDSTSMVLPSVKDLASSEASTRRVCLKNILNHLQGRSASSSLPSSECLQLWKGFFVVIYMHDSKNAISVQNLLKEIAGTFRIFDNKDIELHQGTDESKPNGQDAENSWLEPYHNAFWQTLVKEWATIDSHRMNKYLLLVRFVMRELATICLHSIFHSNVQGSSTSTNGKARKRKSRTDSKNEKDDTVEVASQLKIKSVVDVLQTDGPLNTKDRKIPDGLRLHLLDLYATETFAALSTLMEEAADQTTKPQLIKLKEMLDGLKSPVLAMSQSDSGAPRNVRMKAKEALEEFGLNEDEIMQTS